MEKYSDLQAELQQALEALQSEYTDIKDQIDTYEKAKKEHQLIQQTIKQLEIEKDQLIPQLNAKEIADCELAKIRIDEIIDEIIDLQTKEGTYKMEIRDFEDRADFETDLEIEDSRIGQYLEERQKLLQKYQAQ